MPFGDLFVFTRRDTGTVSLQGGVMGKTFKEFLREQLVFSPKYSVAVVHERFNKELLRLGLPTIALSTFFNYLSDKGPTPPVEWVAPLYNVTNEISIINFVLNNTSIMPALRPQAGEAKGVKDELLDAVGANSRLFTETINAIKDNKFTAEEVDSILAAIDGAELELEDLRKSVRSGDIPLNSGNGSH